MREYDSPLKTFLDNTCELIANETDNMVWNAITKVGIDIDRDKLIQALTADKKRYEDAYEAGYDHGYMDRVVLCRDCANGRRVGKGVECIYCSVWDYMMPEDGYCHMGKKEGEED